MKILIVDDEPLVRKSLGRACRSRGHEVIEAVDGKEGLRMWIDSTPDLVFLDVLMPGLSGPEVLAEIDRLRSEGSQAGIRSSRVILMSAYAGEHELRKTSGDRGRFGEDLFIPKPFENVFEIVDKAEELIGRAADAK